MAARGLRTSSCRLRRPASGRTEADLGIFMTRESPWYEQVENERFGGVERSRTGRRHLSSATRYNPAGHAELRRWFDAAASTVERSGVLTCMNSLPSPSNRTAVSTPVAYAPVSTPMRPSPSIGSGDEV